MKPQWSQASTNRTLFSLFHHKMSMQVIFGVLCIFMQTAIGLLFQDPVICRFTVNNQCSVALGQRLHLQLPLVNGFNLNMRDNMPAVHVILRYRKNNPQNENPPRWQFYTETNTMILSSAERNDSGTYMLDTFDEKGTAADSYILQLRIEAEVTTVNLWYTCLSSEGMKVYCSADGDNITYSWTSNLHPLAQLENGTNNHTLSKEHNGKVTCFIENHVSHHRNTIVLHQCSSFTPLFTLVWLFEIIIFLSLLAGTNVYTRLKETKNKEQLRDEKDQEAL